MDSRTCDLRSWQALSACQHFFFILLTSSAGTAAGLCSSGIGSSDRISMHPTNEELATYMFGQSSTELLERIEEHMDDCGECALTVARLVRALIRAPEPPDAV